MRLDRLLETLANKKRRRILNALLSSHPAPMKIKDIASKGKIIVKTAYGEPYLGRLVRDGLIMEIEEQEEKGGPSSYIIENVNSLLCDRYANYSLAPGNVEYSEKFKTALDRLINQEDIKNHCRTLLGFVNYIVESVKESKEEHVKQIAPGKGTGYVCSTCGLNHEARDFIRATLLYLLDQLETSPDYLEYLSEQNYIDKEHYNEYYELIRENLKNRNTEGLETKTQFTNEEQIVAHATYHKEPITGDQSTLRRRNEEQIVAEAWFKRLQTRSKKIAEWILSAKPELSKEQSKHLTDSHKSKSHSRSELDAIYGVAQDLEVSLSEDLILEYFERKKHEEYENRPEVVKRRNELRKKRRAKSR